MRTTVTLDPDVEKLIRRTLREKGQSFKTILNAAIRRGLSYSEKPRPFRQKTFRLGAPAPGADLTKALALAAGLEDAEIIRKLKTGK